MDEPTDAVRIDLRIPGKWSNPGELIQRLPSGHRLTPEFLILPDGTQVEFGALDADRQFARVFSVSCRQPATKDELATIANYKANIVLSGPGGSMEAARAMMQAGAAIVRAGGAGVFIDNSALAHGGQNWLAMADDGGPDALSFAYVSIIRGDAEVWTMGMHALGLRDIVMKRADVEIEGFDIIEMIRYMCRSETPVENGHVIADLEGPRFQVIQHANDEASLGSAMHNPFGRLKLMSIRDIAETN